MTFEDNTNAYTIEHIIEHTTDGVDEWNATRKERITRCGDCLFYRQALIGGTPYGYCKGRHKYATGYCDEGIRK